MLQEAADPRQQCLDLLIGNGELVLYALLGLADLLTQCVQRLLPLRRPRRLQVHAVPAAVEHLVQEAVILHKQLFVFKLRQPEEFVELSHGPRVGVPVLHIVLKVLRHGQPLQAGAHKTQFRGDLKARSVHRFSAFPT